MDGLFQLNRKCLIARTGLVCFALMEEQTRLSVLPRYIARVTFLTSSCLHPCLSVVASALALFVFLVAVSFFLLLLVHSVGYSRLSSRSVFML